jgi:solute carrier family 45 protein 1/2/4
VIPQFLVTGLASIVFAIVEPNKSVVHGHHPGIITPVGNGTSTATASREEVGSTSGPNSVAIIFR